jgi:hypothetical protein
MRYMWVKNVNKPINNLNGIFSGVTRYNWWSEVVKYPNIVQYFFLVMVSMKPNAGK